MALAHDRLWTYEDYLQLPDDGKRYEVLEGKLYVSPSPSTAHQKVVLRLTVLLYKLEEQGLGFLFAAPMDLLFPGADPVQPDLMYFTVAQKDQILPKFCVGAPTLIVEVLSPSTRSVDRVTKLHLYARNGIPYYWLADPLEKTLEILQLDGETYRVAAALAPGDRYEGFPGAAVDVEELFRDLPVEAA